MSDISGFGATITIIASTTFPVGFQVTQFADDADPVDFASVKIADAAMGLNGDIVTWSKPIPLPMVLNILPGTQDDINLSLLANAVRPVKGKALITNNLSAVLVYPDLTQITLINGIMTDAPFGRSISSAGRQKTRTFAFLFQQNVGN